VAFSSRELLLILRARDEASRVVRGFAAEFSAVDAAAMKAARNQISAGSALMSVGIGIAGVGAAGLVWLKNSTDKAVEFNNEIARTATQLDDVKASQQDLANVVKRTGNDIAVPIEQLHQGLFDIFSSMEVSLPQSEMLLRSFAKEAVAGQVELKEASRATIGILNAFHLKVEDVTRVQDVQFQLVRKGVGTYEEFAKVMGRATPSAARAGQSVETLSGMLAFLTRNGLSAAMAAASAGRAFDAFAHPVTVKRLQAMGVQVKDAEGNFRKFGDVMVDLQKALGDMTAPERAEALQKLFKGSGGTIQARRFYDAVLKDEQSVQQFVNLVGDMENAQGAFSQAYDTMADTTASKSQVLKNQWELLRIEVGTALVPVLERLMEILSGVLRWWNSLDEGTRKQIVTWVALGAAISVALGIVTSMAGAFLMLSGAAAAAGIGLLPMLGIIATVVAAVVAMIAIAVLLAKNWDKVTRAIGAAWDVLWSILKPIIDWINREIGEKLGALWKRISDDIIAATQAVGQWITRIWTGILSWAQTVWPNIQGVISFFTDWFKAIWPDILAIISNILNILVDTFSGVWTAIVGVIQGAWQAISGVIEGIINIFKGIISFIVGVLTLNWSQAWDGIKLIFEGIWQAISGIVKGVWTAIVGIIRGAWEIVTSIVSNGAKAIWNLIKAALDTIRTAWDAIWSWVSRFFGGIWEGLKKGAKSALQGLKDAFQSGIDAIKIVWNTLSGILKAPVNFVIEFIYNKGIRWLWNKVADFVGLPLLPEIKKLAGGGYISGPGGPRDDKIPALLSNGEYVMPADKTSRYYPYLEAMRAGKQLPGFAVGGPIGNVINWIGDVGKNVIDTISDPVGWLMKKVGSAAKAVKFIASIPVAIIKKVGSHLWNKITTFEAKPWHYDLIKFLSDDTTGKAEEIAVKGLQRFANQQRGKKYLWGAVGPNNYDCSGLVGSMWGLVTGKGPYKRYFTTATMGVGKHGMKRGPGLFTIYLGPGHTAANVGGMHVEAYGGNGTPLAIGRVGTPLSFYRQTMHMFREGGLVALRNDPVARMTSFLKCGWPEPPGSFDQGGWLMPGLNFNNLRRPEPVLTPGQYDTLLRIANGDEDGKQVTQNFYITTQEIDPRKHAADLGFEITHGRVT
jgi:TP901 family phage tail tape measure protein